MWRIPKDTPQTAESNGRSNLEEVTTSTPVPEIFEHWNRDGAVVIKALLSSSQIADIQNDLEPILEKVQRGSIIEHDELQAFHGRKTRYVSMSKSYSLL